uniref:Cytochrome b-c1 complex subunit 1, mitochondrial n=1 Tax=Latimeria chalumnae TaxID=7897 RepID=H3BB10_LATCH
MAASLSRAGSALVRAARPAFLSLKRNQSAVSYAQTLLGVPETKVTTLDNGLRVACEESGQPTCTVGVWIEAGSRYENESNNGSAFFLEHLAFKGTKKRPQPALEQEVETMGAHMNAYTSRELTAYYMKSLSTDLPKVVEILADVVQNSSLGNAEVEREREVILREMQEFETNLQDVVFDYLHATAFQGTPLSRTVLGPTQNVKTVTRAELQEYISHHYKAPRMVLAAAGGVKHNELVNLAKEHFSGVSFEYEADAIPVLSPCRFTGSEIRVRDDDMPLAHIAIAVEAVAWSNPDIVALMVASTLIGNYDVTYGGGKNLSSKLAQVAAENKVCQSFQSFLTCYSDTGLFGLHFVTDAQNIEDMLHFAQGQWMSLCTSVTDSEVNRAKMALKTNLVGQLDGSNCSFKKKKKKATLHFLRKRGGGNLKAISLAIDSPLVKEKKFSFLSGPIEQLPDYNRIRSAMYWLRF